MASDPEPGTGSGRDESVRSRWCSELRGEALVLRNGTPECDLTWSGSDSLSMILNSAAATCEISPTEGHAAWAVTGLTIRLERVGTRSGYSQTLEGFIQANLNRVFQLVLRGKFSRRFAAKRKGAHRSSR